MQIISKILKISILLFLILLIVNFIPAFFFKKEINHNSPLKGYVKGVYHVHSFFSDGLGSIEDITTAADRLNLDFVILTDHGVPNLNCYNSTKYLNNVLLVGGSEFSLDSGHMASAGFKADKYRIPLEPQEAIDKVNFDGGFTFTAHPFDKKIPWTNWDIKDFTGIEILNSYSCAKKIGFMGIFSFPLEYLINKDYSLLETLYYPEKNIEKWDYFNKTGKYYGIFALDAHAKLPVTDKFVLKFPSYYSMFRIFNIYVKTDEKLPSDPHKASKLIINSIKSGHYFNVVEAIASADGFDTFFLDRNSHRFEEGDTIEDFNGEIYLILPFKFRTNIILRKDGRIIKRINYNIKDEIRFKIKDSGVYRTEIFVSDSRYKNIPWIIINPFFPKKTAAGRNEKKSYVIREKSIDFDPSLFHIEKNNNSDGLYKYNSKNHLNQIFYHLKKDERKKDFWVSLAYRKNLDFSGFNSFSFTVESDKDMRFWLEIRTYKEEKELWFRHSFLATPQRNEKRLYFKDFKCINKKNCKEKIDLRNITSLFFSLNNSIVIDSEVSGRLELSNFKLIK